MTPVTEANDITRPERELCTALAAIGTATASGELSRMGIRNPFIRGPQSFKRGRSVAGPALTLQFMPKREDMFEGGEYDSPELQLHRNVMYPVQAGDMIVVDARGDMDSGVFGEMMLTYFAGRGGAGVVIDGCIRDSGPASEIDVGIWVRGVTPNYHAQAGIIPFGVNVPIACGGALVMPGDIVIADDDGAVVVPAKLAGELMERAGEHAEWEVFSRLMLSRGGDLRKYYPLSEEGEAEYVAWRNGQSAEQSAKG